MIEASTRCAHVELMARLRPFVGRRVPSSADVDDIVQDIFLRMQRGLGELRDEDRFGPWVYRVARSSIADHRRARARHPLANGDPPDEAFQAEDAEEARPCAEELAACAVVFVAALPSPYREALTLTELEGITQREAAEMLGVSVSAMKSRVQRGRAQLRKMFEDCCEIALDARGGVISCEPRRPGQPGKGCSTR